MRTAMYARVSTVTHSQQHTLEEQINRLRARLLSRGKAVAEEHIFRDEGRSGATLNRPALDRLRDQVRLGDYDRILVTSPDRLARNYVHQMLLLEELERAGCTVEFLDQPVGDTPHDHLLLQIRGAVAEYERALIGDRMRRGRLARYRAGLLLPWTRPVYGYLLDPEHPRDPKGVRISAAEAAVVRQVFAWYLEEGLSLSSIVNRLFAHGKRADGACGGSRCRSRLTPAGQLDELVWSDLCEVIREPQLIALELERAWGGSWLPEELAARRESLRKARAGLQQQVERLTEAYLGGVLDLMEYERRRREIEGRAEAFASQERELGQQVGRRRELAGMVAGVEDYCRRVSEGLAGASFEQKRRLVELLIDRVIVTEEEVEVRYVIPTSASGEPARFCHLRTNYLPADSEKDERGLEVAPLERGLIELQAYYFRGVMDELKGGL
jgi:DNA invertase Pin-like site-specific DNA recombinase